MKVDQKLLTATVVSDKPKSTIIVKVERLTKHPVYGKYIRQFSKLVVHDPKDEAKVGDVVTIVKSRPLSKTKRWLLKKVVKGVQVQA